MFRSMLAISILGYLTHDWCPSSHTVIPILQCSTVIVWCTYFERGSIVPNHIFAFCNFWK